MSKNNPLDVEKEDVLRGLLGKMTHDVFDNLLAVNRLGGVVGGKNKKEPLEVCCLASSIIIAASTAIHVASSVDAELDLVKILDDFVSKHQNDPRVEIEVIGEKKEDWPDEITPEIVFEPNRVPDEGKNYSHYVLTFGPNHRTEDVDLDGWVSVYAEDYAEAREYIFKLYGPKWSHLYAWEGFAESTQFFPNGEVDIYYVP